MNPLKKQPPRGVLEKRCSEYVQQVYRRTPMPECGFRTLQNAFFQEHLWTAASALRSNFFQNFTLGLKLMNHDTSKVG